MPNLTTTLCLLVVLIAYGIAGRFDYEEAVRREEADRREIVDVLVDCDVAPDSARAADPASDEPFAVIDRPACPAP